MSNSFDTYRLNPDIKERIKETVEDPAMQDFLVWLLEWEGTRLNYSRVPSLADITQEIDKLVESLNEDS
ncbi:hypothetical protein [Spectribacter hydrogenoxidans]|uniref:Uncharacterized protein n=1 Tax=Spectribacter hydrogenoxidans TaxID=3075608 RepID=A0ABU3C004_9GAMM|nr:hypothetical protein [Salinisphaera sp. W335]MDT0634886.1 hypothetical protein [Salinisphaera sp. W335]